MPREEKDFSNISGALATQNWTARWALDRAVAKNSAELHARLLELRRRAGAMHAPQDRA